jgi:chorismate dehydratase
VANKPIPAEFIEAFDAANGYGLNHLDEVISLIPANEQEYDLYKYYTENISYKLTPEKKKGLELFLELIKNK